MTKVRREKSCSLVAPISPMRRGLKRYSTHLTEIRMQGCTDLPDEEGTETAQCRP